MLENELRRSESFACPLPAAAHKLKTTPGTWQTFNKYLLKLMKKNYCNIVINKLAKCHAFLNKCTTILSEPSNTFMLYVEIRTS